MSLNNIKISLDKILDKLQWIPAIGVPITIYVAIIGKPYSIILAEKTFISSGVWHGITSCIVFICMIETGIL